MQAMEISGLQFSYPAGWKKKTGKKTTFQEGFVKLVSPHNSNYYMALGWQRQEKVMKKYKDFSSYVEWFIDDLKRQSVHFDVLVKKQFSHGDWFENKVNTHMVVKIGGLLIKAHLEQSHYARIILCNKTGRIILFYGVMLGPQYTEEKEEMLMTCLNSLHYCTEDSFLQSKTAGI